jgi:hypothetical protein
LKHVVFLLKSALLKLACRALRDLTMESSVIVAVSFAKVTSVTAAVVGSIIKDRR